jgi:hypothetical protein
MHVMCSAEGWLIGSILGLEEATAIRSPRPRSRSRPRYDARRRRIAIKTNPPTAPVIVAGSGTASSSNDKSSG